MKSLKSCLIATILSVSPVQADDWTIDSANEWEQSIESSDGVVVADGVASPTERVATITTKINSTSKKRSAKSLVVNQSPIWQNWNPIENLGPANLGDAPVLLTVGPDNYWMFGRYLGARPVQKTARQKNGQKAKPAPAFKAESATLAGFDMELLTTPFPNQYDAPGGLKT